MKLVLLGIQGAGKSTQGNILSEKLGIPYLSTGHILRGIAKEKTTQGRYIKETLNSGILVPDRIMIPMVEGYLNRSEYQKGYIMDGFPRTVEQAKVFKNHLTAVIYLHVTDREALWRLSYREAGDREDETLVAIRKRIEMFHQYTEPVLDYYRQKGILVEIDGEKEIKEISSEILERVHKLASNEKDK